MQTAILVAGMHRSGTSATAGALAKMGISLGRQLLEPGGDNPKGYWENERAVDIHERLLAELQRSWDDVRALPTGWVRSAPAKRAAAAIDDLIRDEFSDAPLWAVKDPRICRLLPLWIAALQKRDTNPVVLFVVRPPDEVAASIAARNGWDPALSRMLWLRYQLEAEKASRGLPRTVLTYQSLLREPAGVVTAALAELGVEVKADRKALRRFVDAGERHHSDTKLERSGDSGLGDFCDEVFASFARIAEGRGDWDELRRHGDEFVAGWRRWGGNVDAAAAMAGALRMQLEAGKAQAAKISGELNSQLEWARDSVAKHDALDAERARLQSELTAQLAWSETAVAKHEQLEAERARLRSELDAQLGWSKTAVAKHEQLEAERARLRSELDAQLSWSETAVAKHEQLEADRARLQSDLTAQLRWSEETLAAHQLQVGAAQAELARMSSELAAQVAWSRDFVGKYDALEAERARLQSDLTAQLRWSEDAVAKHEQLEAERARLQSDLTAQVRWSEEAVTTHRREVETLEARNTGLAGQIAELNEMLAQAQSRQRDTDGIVAGLRQDLSRAFADLDLSRTESREREEQRQLLAAEKAELSAQLREAQASLAAVSSELAHVLSSRSWRFTRPARSLAEQGRRLIGRPDKA